LGKSYLQAEFIVAIVKENDIILDILFLAVEGILINLAQQKVILPQPVALSEGLRDGIEEDSIGWMILFITNYYYCSYSLHYVCTYI
jgi:hypothetical protein